MSAGWSIVPWGAPSVGLKRRIVPALSPAATCAESPRQATDSTSAAAESIRRAGLPDSRSQIVSPLPEAAAACLPSGRRARAGMPAGPARVFEGASEPGISQILADLSWLPERIRLLAGSTATASTISVCPWRVLIAFRVVGSQTLIVESGAKAPVTTFDPSGAHATE